VNASHTKLVLGGVIVALISLIVGLVSFIVTERFSQVDRNTESLERITEVLRIVVAVTGCTTEDTAEQCRQRLRDGSTAEGARRTAEVDCLTRRALAGLPAPIPPTTCVDQTPPSIYPGEQP
jgi:hypothetical protein